MTGLAPPAEAFRWDGNFWWFYVESWGGWQKLRIGTETASRPMTYSEGLEYVNRRYAA